MQKKRVGGVLLQAGKGRMVSACICGDRQSMGHGELEVAEPLRKGCVCEV